MIFVPIILLTILTAIFAFKEAVLYSRKGSDGMIWLLTEKYDHTVWILERITLMHLVASMILVKGDTEYAIIITSWLAQFMFVHQLAYNCTMVIFKMPKYRIGIAESTDTTATKTAAFVKITLLIIGIAAPIAYYLI